MDFAIAKVSTKGQIVIPSMLREDIRPGDEFLIVRDDQRLILKNMTHVAIDMKDDLAFAERVEAVWREHDKGGFKRNTSADFLLALER